MKVLQKISGSLLLLLTLSSAAPGPPKTDKIFISNYENVLGTSLELKVISASGQNAGRAELVALAEIDRLNKILSGYDPSSEFSRWMNAPKKPVQVSPELYEVLSLFEQWRLKSSGALDASAETIGKVWRNATKQKRLPSTEEIADAVATVKQRHYILDPNNQTALRTSDAALMLNSFAKSYIMDKAAKVAMATPGVSGLVVNIGGDILVRGLHTEQIQVSDPKADAENDPPIARLEITGKTVATSGNYRRGEQINGKWYSHIIDPRTGQPGNAIISATVIASIATDAGALATALNVLTPEEGKKLVASVPGAEYMLITTGGKRFESPGWMKFEQSATQPQTVTKLDVQSNLINNPTQHPTGGFHDPNFEITINLELATIEGMRVYRPFVAVWVTGTDKKPVRLISLWYNKSRWLDEIPFWYAAYHDALADPKENISSTTSATRGAGKYTLKWDGKDDKGIPVLPGSYTIFIEAARQHGSHQLMTQKITLGKAQHIDIPGNSEIASASLDYRIKGNGN